MNTIAIIAIAYTILDIIVTIAIYAILRFNGWTAREMALLLHDIVRWPQEDFIEEFAAEYGFTDEDLDGEE